MVLGLALGAGGSRALAHVGAIKVLHAMSLPIRHIAGGSIGALVGGLYALGYTPDELSSLRLGRRLRRAIRPKIGRAGLLDPAPPARLIRELFGGATFAQTRIPLAVSALDLLENERVVLREGSIAEAVIASMMIPALFPPAYAAGRWLNDPGIFNPIPIDVVAQMGADVVVGLSGDLEPSRPPRLPPHLPPISLILRAAAYVTGIAGGTARNFWSDAAKVLRRMSQGTVVFPSMARLIWVQPEFRGMSANDFGAGEQAERLGAEAAQRALPEITAALRGEVPANP